MRYRLDEEWHPAPKTFRYDRGEWRNAAGLRIFNPAWRRWVKPEGADAILYREHELALARAEFAEWGAVDSLVVWWTEGEKDCDAVRRSGLGLAVAHHQAAGHSTVSQAEKILWAGHIVICLDRDAPGSYCGIKRYRDLTEELGYPDEQISLVWPKYGLDMWDHLVGFKGRLRDVVPVDMKAVLKDVEKIAARRASSGGNGGGGIGDYQRE